MMTALFDINNRPIKISNSVVDVDF